MESRAAAIRLSSSRATAELPSAGRPSKAEWGPRSTLPPGKAPLGTERPPSPARHLLAGHRTSDLPLALITGPPLLRVKSPPAGPAQAASR